MSHPPSDKPPFRPAKSRFVEEQIATAFFGRRKGKPISPTQQALIDDLLPRISLNPTKPVPDMADLYGKTPREVWMEIGFGGGEHMVRQASNNPDVGFIGCEPFINGVVKALSQISDASIENIRIYDEDAAHILDWLPEASLDRIYLLYPDPWPKKRHLKRRFVSERNLNRFLRVLKPGGLFRFASDIEDYVDWVLTHMEPFAEFAEVNTTPAQRLQPWQEWQRTRYEEKALREGRTPQYLTFARK